MSASLADLEVLILDCQATGPKPGKGHLLEIGWISTQACKAGGLSSLQPRSFVVSLPTGTEIPKQVSKVTGIVEEDLADGVDPLDAWKEVVAEANRVMAKEDTVACPTVIHFARYEEPYLRHLHEHVSRGTSFPLNIICSWEIVRRLLPQLPRRGLRAVSGYLGHSVPERRRSAHHVVATAVIWNECVEMLEEEHGIRDLNQLREWLARYTVSKVRRKYPMDPNVRLALPDHPGLYRMLRSNGDVLYVGKSTSLRRRVNSYFQKQTRHAEHILEMLTQARNIDISTTDSALEAALIESDEIKRLSPPYNVALRNRDRVIGFCTADMKHFDSKASRSHRFGPVPLSEPFQLLPHLWESRESPQSSQSSDILDPDMLGFTKDRGPDVASLISGIEEFRIKHRRFETMPTLVRLVASLGFELWQARQLERDQEEEKKSTGTTDIDQGLSEADEGIPDWTPERVVSLLESLTLRAAHLLRRARWFTLLSECSMAWQTASSSSARRNLIIIRSGNLAKRNSLSSDRPPPPPPGHLRRRADRQQCFDLATYDRLSILTAELKRLSGSGRTIELRFGERSRLTEVELTRVLSWL
jgi:DNA polymerase-3 subunit epsilon